MPRLIAMPSMSLDEAESQLSGIFPSQLELQVSKSATFSYSLKRTFASTVGSFYTHFKSLRVMPHVRIFEETSASPHRRLHDRMDLRIANRTDRGDTNVG